MTVRLEHIVVWSRRQAQYGYLLRPYDLITINDPDHEPVHPREGVVGSVLPLHFADLDLARYATNGGVHPDYGLGSTIKWGRPLHQWVMTIEQAAAVVKFCLEERRHPTLVVHCHAGLSRSPSAAFAIADCLGVSRQAIDWPAHPPRAAVGRQAPNLHVYNLLVQEFGKRGLKRIPATHADWVRDNS